MRIRDDPRPQVAIRAFHTVIRELRGVMTVGVEQHAFLVFQLAQIRGWSPADLRHLSRAEWAALVGPQIARVTQPLSITRQGTLFVAVTTNGWMTELSLMEPELLRRLNQRTGRLQIRKIRWQIRRD